MKEIKWNKLGKKFIFYTVSDIYIYVYIYKVCLTNFIFKNLKNHRIGSDFFIYFYISRLKTLGKGNSSSCHEINSEIYDKVNGFFFFNIMKHWYMPKQWIALKASSDWLRKL